MKSVVLTFGLIAGAILSIMMVATIPFMERIGFDNGMLIGYTTMVLAFLMVFFGIRSYRDNVANGDISFARGFKVGALITLVASICYVVTWEVIYYKVAPGFMDAYGAHAIEKERVKGASEAELEQKRTEMAKFKELYQNPLFNAGITLLEVMPVGLIVTGISAGILRKRRGQPA